MEEGTHRFGRPEQGGIRSSDELSGAEVDAMASRTVLVRFWLVI